MVDCEELKSNRRILVFLNMSLQQDGQHPIWKIGISTTEYIVVVSRQGPALVSSVVVHKELLYVYSRGVSPSFFFYSADPWSKENIGMVDHDWW